MSTKIVKQEFGSTRNTHQNNKATHLQKRKQKKNNEATGYSLCGSTHGLSNWPWGHGAGSKTSRPIPILSSCLPRREGEGGWPSLGLRGRARWRSAGGGGGVSRGGIDRGSGVRSRAGRGRPADAKPSCCAAGKERDSNRFAERAGVKR